MNDRQVLINEYIQARGEVSLSALKKLVPNVSEMTIRRDLEALESGGKIIRIHGGARSVKAINMLVEDVFSKRSMTNTAQKRLIAEKALSYVGDNSSVFIDSGSTAMALAEIIPDKKLLISTCGLNVAAELLRLKNSRINLIGGEVNKDSISTYGPSARLAVDSINIDVAFIAATAFSPKYGFSCGHSHDSELKNAVLKRAMLRIVLMDSSKIGTMMPYTFADASDIDILICDDNITEESRALFAENGAKVI